LLKGVFAGMSRIIVDVLHDEEGKVRRLDFHGEREAAPAPAEPVAAAAPGAAADGSAA
jgi:hypothetical protein